MAAVRYLHWDGEEFSTAWYWVIRAAVRDGIIKITDVNDAHRSMQLQAQRVREHGLWSPSNPTGAAPPTPSAPHIRIGREDHALDIQTSAVGRIMWWLAHNGVRTHRPVLDASGQEPWHVEAVDEAALSRFGRRCYERLRQPRFTAREKRLMNAPNTRRTRLALRAQARLVQVAARRSRSRRGGWDRYDRVNRFQALRRKALA